jgi:hypothetical protein
MQPDVTRDGSGVPRWMPICGAGLLIVVAGLLEASIRGWLPSWLSIVLGALAVALFVLVIPALLRSLVAFTGGLLRLLGLARIPLAQRQVVRRPVRNALTIGVVYVAMSIGIGLGSIITTTVGDVRTWYRQTLQGDFFLRVAFPNNTTGESVLVPDALEAEVGSIPGVTSVDTMRFFNTRVGDRAVVVVSREFPDPDPPIALYLADPHEVRRRLLQGEAVIGTKLAQHGHCCRHRHGLRHQPEHDAVVGLPGRLPLAPLAGVGRSRLRADLGAYRRIRPGGEGGTVGFADRTAI